MSLTQNVINRDKIISALHEEMIGPTTDFSEAKELTSDMLESEHNGKFYYYTYAGVKEEVHYGSPQRKYNSGILYPLVSALAEVENMEELALAEEINKSEVDSDEETETTTNDELVSENKYLPSTFGMTFAVLPSEREVSIQFSCGAYEQLSINPKIQGNDKNWWFRKSLEASFLIPLNDGARKQVRKLVDKQNREVPELELRIDTLVRSIRLKSTEEQLKIVTVSITNITKSSEKKSDTNLMFQCELRASDLVGGFQPYPSAANFEAKIEEEDKKFDLLYSSEKNYGFGQNCSTTWKEKNNLVDEISTTFLPQYEIKTMTPDIVVDGEKIEISHVSLAAAKDYTELQQILLPLLDGYKSWYLKLKQSKVAPYYKTVFDSNLKEIQYIISRIETGINRLSNPNIFNAFRLTNLAMLMQIMNGKTVREIVKDDGKIEFSRNSEDIFNSLDFSTFDSLSKSIKLGLNDKALNTKWKKYKWRGFQIAFLLMSIESFVDKNSEDRNAVDLIWFPTGGGKTEAYLASAAFSILYRRITNPKDIGTDVIMRYTLRLLTADQFQRSARLMCSLDYLRRHFSRELGEEELSLGMWVGTANTPNNIAAAKVRYNEILRNEKSKFPIESCPWCGAEMSLSKSGTYHGYKVSNSEGLIANCPDSSCVFHDKLPIYFVDEQLYRNPPTFIIGTVDKFVQLTWVPSARSLFGIDKKGERIVSPPNLIIQDELHLISGPLGTLTGIYESLIEELCVDRRNANEILPKIICATATIKAYQNQIKSLFAREKSYLFPPAGKDINDNYFSTVQKNKNGENAHGRKYVGVYPFTQGKLQTEVQVMSSLISSAKMLPINERDPFWTVLSFYNSINDIGKALTLTEQDIRHALNNYYDSRNFSKIKRRALQNVKELTSRLDSDKVGLALSEMKEPYKENNNKSIDIVLASNIIEVGVDIDRLSLMTINGQPKTSAQYIQVSGRVGRRTSERPGLVITEYNPTNSNDKSHYEHFIEFHQRLYGQVEESSVTPFSRFSIERGLPAVIVGFLRQKFDIRRLGDAPDYNYLEEIYDDINGFIKRLATRAELIDNTEIEFLKKKTKEILNSLSDKDYDAWEYKTRKEPNNGFMVRMTKEQEDIPDSVIPMMFSMRSVDSISKLHVSSLLSSSEKQSFLSNSNNTARNGTRKKGWFE
ncbi:Helicase conserved C-terminal domain-containing protein [Alkalibacterium putridalgicola]|uniref:DNA helicase n=1 Tax=Alkalibacterium putridalgicola TaxID=426703 RepID=A0A1H7XHV5_9LACT|nr:helicase-related protein [Alkalibacterium putridalgicola]GEK90281.1 DNA helicase [Alkalibacterium putridalgicola]SEM32747.1 Helicase conserved C-terminal domain-containing protein [Alkalibacterium putridalgicola]